MKLTIIALLVCLVVSAKVTQAQILGSNSLEIDFTNPDDATAKATWSKPSVNHITKDGLGWEGESGTMMDGWIQTKPLAVGLSWRPTQAIHVNVDIQPRPQEYTWGNNQKSTSDAGDTYVRYSADKVHWSSWQAMQRNGVQADKGKPDSGRTYNGEFRVPYKDREEYNQLMEDYWKTNPPWASDEEALANWIVKSDPDFFAKHIPFIGYVEFLHESDFHGGQHITSFKANVSFGMGGMSSIPKDPTVNTNRRGPWRFEATEDHKPDENSK